jgi:hypothetical protein
VRCKGCPRHEAPLVKLLVEGFIAPARHAFVWSSGAIVNLSYVDPHNQPINFSSPACPACQRAGVRCRAAQAPKGPLVKLLVEGFHSLHAFVWSVARRKSMVTLLTQPSISLLACIAPCQRAGGEMQNTGHKPSRSSY